MPTRTVTTTGQVVRVPDWVTDHDSFLRWYFHSDIPDDVRIGFIHGHVWVDDMAERAFSHNRIKTAVAETVSSLVRREKLGVFFGDGMTFTSRAGGFTSVPDGVFVSFDAEATGRVWLSGAKKGQHDTKLNGTPDLVVEVVSDGSEDKDTEWLMAGYWNAGIPDYWPIDARGEPLRFAVHERGRKGYKAVRPADGWVRSPVLGRRFRFTEAAAAFGNRDYVLEAA